MLKHTKLSNAKLKILKLKEKYSKTTSITKNKDLSPNHSDSYNYVDLKANELDKEVDINKVKTCEAERLSENSTKFNVGTSEHDRNIHKQLISKPNNLIIGLQITDKSSSSSSLSEKSLKSDTPIQLENIHFISSSSDKFSSISQHILDNNENNSTSNSILIPLKAEVNHSEVNNAEEIKNSSDRDNIKNKSYDKFLSLDQPSHNVSDRTVSSIEEEISNLTYKSENITKDESDGSYLYQNNLVKLSKKSESIDQSTNSSNEGSKIKTSVINATIKHLHSENVLTDDSNQSKPDKNETFGSITTNYSSSTKTINKKRRSREKEISEESHISKTGYYKPRTSDQLLIIHHKCTLKPSKKRPILKSCKLLSNAELSKIEYETILKKYHYLSPPVNIEHKYLCRSRGKTDCFCDGLIKQLLRNQITLTRHFIESHHQMYLNCCKTVKFVNEKAMTNNYN